MPKLEKVKEERYRIHPPLDTENLYLKWIDYEANINLCEMFPQDRTAIKSWENGATEALDYITSKSAPYVVSMRAGGCSWEVIPHILSIPKKAVDAVKSSDYMLFAVEDWVLRMGLDDFDNLVASNESNDVAYLVTLFNLDEKRCRSLLKIIYEREKQ